MPECRIVTYYSQKLPNEWQNTIKQNWSKYGKCPQLCVQNLHKVHSYASCHVLSCHVLSCLVLSCNISEFICIENLVKDAVIKSTHRYWFPDWWIYFFAQFGLQNGRSSKQMINLHKSWSWTAKIIFTQRCIRIQGDCAKSECPFCNGLLYT